METYNLKFITPHVMCSNFKEKDIAFINNVIFGGRLGEKISYVGTGNIRFDSDDKYQFNPICDTLEEFTKSKSNCLIYNITIKDENNPYNKIFVYQVISKTNDNHGYGYILFNDETNECTHVPMISSIVDELIIKINCSLLNQKRYRILESLKKK